MIESLFFCFLAHLILIPQLEPWRIPSEEVVYLCFFYLDLLQNDAIVTSWCMFKFYGESVPTCDEKKKERERGGQVHSPAI